VVGRVRVDRDGHVARARRPDDPAVEHLHAGRRLDQVDPVDDLVGRDPRERIAERPRDAGHRNRVGIDGAVGVAEARTLHRLGHRPGDRVADVGAHGVGRRRPVQVRRRVEVAGDERGDAASQRRPQRAQRVADLRQAREVHVGEREHLPGRDLGEHVLAARRRRVDQRVARDDVQPVAPVRPAERVRDPARVPLGLLQPDDVGVRTSIAATTLPKSTTSPPSQMLNVITRTSAGCWGARGRRCREQRDQQQRGEPTHGGQPILGRHGRAAPDPPL
jgi:hypothetical protein